LTCHLLTFCPPSCLQQVLLYVDSLPCCLGDLPQPTALPQLISAVDCQLCGSPAGQLLGATAFDRLLAAALQAIAGPADGTIAHYQGPKLDNSLQDEYFSCSSGSLAKQQQQQAEDMALQELLQQAVMAGREWRRAACAVLSMRELGWGWWQIVECVVAA
jgi:hypothetical protein